MQPKTTQPLRTWDLLGLFGLIALVVLLPSVIVHSQIQDERLQNAGKQVETLALRLAHARDGGEDRAPASLNPDGAEVDSWGHPLRYQYLRDSDGRAVEVAVWSMGPDGVSESQTVKVAGRAIVQFDGDDIGMTQPVRAEK